jgi:hypothetical protein
LKKAPQKYYFEIEPRLAAAYEVYYLKVVVRLDRRLLPLPTGKNFKIAFDRHAIGCHPDVTEQPGDVQAVRHFAALAVNCDGHGSTNPVGN